MTQEQKDLLLKDLSSRLFYKVKMGHIADTEGDADTLTGIYEDSITLWSPSGFTFTYIEEYRPYLFPLSSLDKDVLEKLNDYGFFKYRDTITNVSCIESNNGISEEIYTYVDIDTISVLIEFFHANHIDYRGLIPMGLALDATGLNIY